MELSGILFYVRPLKSGFKSDEPRFSGQEPLKLWPWPQAARRQTGVFRGCPGGPGAAAPHAGQRRGTHNATRFCLPASHTAPPRTGSFEERVPPPHTWTVPALAVPAAKRTRVLEREGRVRDDPVARTAPGPQPRPQLLARPRAVTGVPCGRHGPCRATSEGEGRHTTTSAATEGSPCFRLLAP